MSQDGRGSPLDVGQVYTTLQRLERDGLVESDSSEAESTQQRGFRITAEGRREVSTWLSTPPSVVPPRDELVIKVLVALDVPGVDVATVLQSHRRRLVELMQTYTRLKEDALDDVRVALVVDAELFRLDALIRWLDSADARVRALATDRTTTARANGALVTRRTIKETV